jgi:hypothetical protein
MDTHAAWNLLLVKIVAFCFFGAGGFLCALNFYLSFLRYPLYCLRGRCFGSARCGWPSLVHWHHGVAGNEEVRRVPPSKLTDRCCPNSGLGANSRAA